jgi:hypothetical protein
MMGHVKEKGRGLCPDPMKELYEAIPTSGPQLKAV